MRRSIQTMFCALGILTFGLSPAQSTYAQSAGGAAGVGAQGGGGAGGAGTGGGGAQGGAGGSGGVSGAQGGLGAQGAGAQGGLGAQGTGAQGGLGAQGTGAQGGLGAQGGVGGAAGAQGAAGGAGNPSIAQQAINANSGINGFRQNPWFSNPALQQQLRLNNTQVEQLRNGYRQAWGRYQNQLNALPNNLNPEQMNRQRLQYQQAFQNEFNQSLTQTLTEENQRRRFNQLALQYQGVNAFNDPSLSERLSLTDAQRRRLEQLQQNWERQIQRMSDRENNVPNANVNWEQFYDRTNRQIEEILNKEQLQTWNEMRGDPYAFPESAYSGDSNE